MNVRDAIESPEKRKAIAVLDHVHAAMMFLMELPTPALEVLRDEFERGQQADRSAGRAKARMVEIHEASDR